MTKDLDFPEAVLVVDSVGTPQKPFKLIEGKPLVFKYVSVGLLSELIK